MTDTEQIRATLTLCLLAAYADRQKHEREGEEEVLDRMER